MPGGALNQGTYEPPPRSDWRMPKPNRSSSPRWSRPYQTVLEVVGQVAREEELVRGRETRHRARVGFRDQGAVPDRQVAIAGVG